MLLFYCSSINVSWHYGNVRYSFTKTIFKNNLKTLEDGDKYVVKFIILIEVEVCLLKP